MRAFLITARFSFMRSFWGLFGWAVPIFLLGWIVVPYYDFVHDNQKHLLQIIASLPKHLPFVSGDNMTKFLTPDGFISLRYFSYIPLVLGIYAAIAGSGMIAADEERGVLDLVMSQPAGRGAVFGGRLVSFLLGLVLILFLSWVGLCLGVAEAKQLDYSPGSLVLPFISAFAVTCFFAMMGLLLSMVMPSRTSAAMITGTFAFGGYIITMLSRNIPAFEPWARFSPHTYFQGDAMKGIDWMPLLGLSGLALMFAAVAWFGFRGRDIRVAGDGGWRWPFFKFSSPPAGG